MSYQPPAVEVTLPLINLGKDEVKLKLRYVVNDYCYEDKTKYKRLIEIEDETGQSIVISL